MRSQFSRYSRMNQWSYTSSMTTKKVLATCGSGHQFYKSSERPTCPVCESKRSPKTDFMSGLVAPARRALAKKGIDSVAKLSQYTESEILALHGMGPSSIPKLRAALEEHGLAFVSG